MIALGLLLAGATVFWHRKLQAEERVLEAQLAALQTRWASVSKQLQEATETEPQLKALISRQKQVTRERNAPGWSPTLRNVLQAAGKDIDVQDVHAGAKPLEPGIGELRISGIAGGESPRDSADRFRVALEAKLGKDLVANAILTQFAQCRDRPEEPGQGLPRGKAAFTITATIRLTDQAANVPENL